VHDRPTHQLAGLILGKQRRTLGEEFAAAAVAFRSPAAGSPRSADVAWLSSQPGRSREILGGILDVAAEDVGEALRMTNENCHAIEVLLAAERILPIPTMTIVRSIHEACLGVCWLADPCLTPEQRTTRAAASTLASIQSSLQTLEQVPNPPPDEVLDKSEAMMGIQDLLTEHGFVLNYGKGVSRYALNVSYGDSLANLKFNVTDAGRKNMPGSRFLWPVGSGATHSRSWFTAGLAGSRSQLAIMATSPLLDIADALADHLLRYVGLDATSFHQRTHLQRRALLQRAEGNDPRDAVAGYLDYAKVRDSPSHQSVGP
jgi:hypothetical protein